MSMFLGPYDGTISMIQFPERISGEKRKLGKKRACVTGKKRGIFPDGSVLPSFSD